MKKKNASTAQAGGLTHAVFMRCFTGKFGDFLVNSFLEAAIYLYCCLIIQKPNKHRRLTFPTIGCLKVILITFLCWQIIF